MYYGKLILFKNSMQAAIEASSSRFWLISNNKNHVYCEYVTKQKTICAKNICCYTSTASIVLTYLRVLIKMYFVPFCSSKAITDSSQHWFFFFCVHVQRYQMLHSSSWESLALPSHCEPHNLQCDVKIIPALNLVVVVTGYKP